MSGFAIAFPVWLTPSTTWDAQLRLPDLSMSARSVS
jgi:hypothetical protein